MGVLEDSWGEGGRDKFLGSDRDRTDVNAERASRFSTQAEKDAIAAGDYSSAGKFKDIGYDKAVTGYETESLGWGQRAWSAIKGFFTGTQALGGVLSGTPGGLIGGAKLGKTSADLLREAFMGSRTTYHNADGSPTQFNQGPTSGAASPGSKDGSQEKGLITELQTSKPAPAAAPAPAPTANVFDYFTSIPRQPVNWEDTFLTRPTKTTLGE